MSIRTTRVSYPLTEDRLGRVETILFSEYYESLSGIYLDYALACVDVNNKAILIEYMLGLIPHRVLAGIDFSNLKTWSPIADKQLANELIASHYIKESDTQDESTLDKLKCIVKNKIGQFVALPKPTREFG